ncbi:DUF4249 domain-containing protein [uncultured Fibrella sp.]|uniref:DUF4249 domain-containing protein n=1 Tax=uncultured Fibrella sp. TaxID=1284596 RepID=UPI0035CC077A
MNWLYTTRLACLLLLLVVGSCVDPYRPPEISSPESYLVVSGFFNSTPGASTAIRLSRTQNLTDNKTPILETKAQVTIESKGKTNYVLTEGSSATYTLAGITPQAGEMYRLHIRTARGSEYYSDYVPVVKSPPIDSVSWRIDEENVQINVNTHDPTNNTRYYRWDYDETWEYKAIFNSLFELKSNEVINRQESLYNCWSSGASTNIITTSTTRLSKDIVSQFPVAYIPGSSPKFGIKYSILVKQMALTQAGFNYYDQLAKLTQNIGSVFDPQPTQITGNIHSATNESELVMGFFRVGSVETKRIFIANSQLPKWPPYYGDGGCLLDTLLIDQVRKNQSFIVTTWQPPPGTTIFYLTTTQTCMDCRLRGGTNKQPDFWK